MRSGLAVVSISGLVMLTSTAVGGLATSRPNLPPLSGTTSIAPHLPLARSAMEYLDASPDPFHAVQTSIERLEAAGFTSLSETSTVDTGKIVPGGKYYFTRNKSTLVAFAVGDRYQPGNGFKIIGGHTDSPNLRVKPRSLRTAAGCVQVGVECYGGGLWHTWFDRDLGVSGRVLVRSRDDARKVTQRLVRMDRALLRVSNLAIHLQSAKEREAFKVNKEDDLSPILAMEAEKSLNGGENKTKDGWTEYQEPALLEVLAHELNVRVEDIADFELTLFDVQKASLGGVFSEFIHSSRLDNLASCFLAVQALVDHVEAGSTAKDSDISMIVLYDHEEVGSNSAVGAASPIMAEAVQRIAAALGNQESTETYAACIRNSFCCSVDQAHALHPNYASKHEKNHQPKMNQGIVIKRNANQRYATNAVTGFLMREISRRAGLPPIQEFIVRQDCGCGSTIGPLISTATGIRTIDMGCPQLSMHSIRETMGVCDLTN